MTFFRRFWQDLALWVRKRSKAMPVYRFRCGKCGLEFWDLVMKGWETQCPECGEKKDLKRLIGRFGVRYKGEGFHGRKRRS